MNNNERKITEQTEIQTSVDTFVNDYLKGGDHPALIVLQGENIGSVHRLREGITNIGRSSDADISIKQRAVSNLHARLVRNGADVHLEDLKSTNGTLLNNAKIANSTKLIENDIIRLGKVVFRFVSNRLDIEFAENLHSRGTRDPLTNAFNRDYFFRVLKSSMEIAQGGYPLALIMLDLDHFKKVNDTYGHVGGDFVLKETCRILQESVIRSEDCLGRYGGEEFAILLPETTIDVAKTVAERIRAEIENHNYQFDGKKITVTASLGVDLWKPTYKKPEDFIDVVDKLLYESKSGGRNRVSFIS